MPNLQRSEARRELAQFVRERRGRTRPQDVGLQPGERRRTPGLRREEVAQLVGVSVTWYTWFEQGRDIQVSTRFLNGVSDALRLDDAERAMLFELANPPASVGQKSMIPAVPARQAPSEGWDYRPPVVLAPPRLVPAGPPPPDPETDRINHAIRRIIAGEEERTPPRAPVPAGRTPHGIRWSLGVTVLGVLMLLPISAVS